MENKKVDTNREANLVKTFKERLLQLGYPQESIISEYKLGRYRADIVIIDIKTETPIQLFELKTNKNIQTINMAKFQLKNYLDEAKKINADVIGYLILPSTDGTHFDVMQFDGENDFIKNEMNFNYTDQVNRSRSIKAELLNNRKIEAVDGLKEKINTLLEVFFVLFCFDIFNIIEITNIRFYLLITVSVLYVLPYYEEIKIFNLELKRHRTKNNVNEE
jgi:hypothetical protein